MQDLQPLVIERFEFAGALHSEISLQYVFVYASLAYLFGRTVTLSTSVLAPLQSNSSQGLSLHNNLVSSSGVSGNLPRHSSPFLKQVRVWHAR